MEVCWFAYMQIEGLKSDSHQDIINYHRQTAHAIQDAASEVLEEMYRPVYCIDLP